MNAPEKRSDRLTNSQEIEQADGTGLQVYRFLVKQKLFKPNVKNAFIIMPWDNTIFDYNDLSE